MKIRIFCSQFSEEKLNALISINELWARVITLKYQKPDSQRLHWNILTFFFWHLKKCASLKHHSEQSALRWGELACFVKYCTLLITSKKLQIYAILCSSCNRVDVRAAVICSAQRRSHILLWMERQLRLLRPWNLQTKQILRGRFVTVLHEASNECNESQRSSVLCWELLH